MEVGEGWSRLVKVGEGCTPDKSTFPVLHRPPPSSTDLLLIQKPRRHARRRLDQLLRGLHKAHHDRQRPFQHELALHAARNGAELFPKHALPALIAARDHEACLASVARLPSP